MMRMEAWMNYLKVNAGNRRSRRLESESDGDTHD
jgi:hypothetical protein